MVSVLLRYSWSYSWETTPPSASISKTKYNPTPCYVWILERGGRSYVSASDYLEGSPELVVEIAASSVAYDLYDKRRVYARNGVREYVALQMYERRVDWFVLREGVYESLTPDGEGVIRSEVFPGLWLQPDALLAGDLAEVLRVLQVGLASAEHVEFAASLR